MPAQARHAAGLVLSRRGYRSIAGGPIVWRSGQARGDSHSAAGGWSGHFVLDGAPDAIFDVTEWIDRDHDLPVVRYAYQVRYCSGVHEGTLWQYRLDLHPIDQPTASIAHHHDQAVTDDEHDPRPWDRRLTIAQALPVLEQRALSSLGPCAGRPPGVRGRAPHEPGKGSVVTER